MKYSTQPLESKDGAPGTGARNQRPRIALIGVTGYGRIHLDELKGLVSARKAELTAATVINPEDAPEQMAWLRQTGAEIFPDYREMLDRLGDQLDLCCIPTAISMHRPMVEAALSAGANVLVEKPLAGCPEDARAIVEAGERAGRFVAVGFQAVWSPLTGLLLDAIHGGTLGRVRKIAVRGFWPRPQTYFARNGWAGRLRDAHGIVNDSPANNALAHFLNLALLFSGPEPYRCARVKEVVAERIRANEIENYDTVLAEMTTDTGAEIFYGVSHAAGETFEPRLDIIAENGTAMWSMASGSLTIQGGPPQTLPGGGDAESRPLMFGDVARAAAGESGLIFPAKEAMAHVEAIAAFDRVGSIIDRRADAVPQGDPENPVMTLPGLAEGIHRRAEAFLNA
jgi:predicted dehydrogenase